MQPTLTNQELCELKMRFNDIIINESLNNEEIVHTLSSGRIVKGAVSENQVLQIKSITNFLLG